MGPKLITKIRKKEEKVSNNCYARAPIYRYANLRVKDQALTAMLAIN
jgi:hypothetical protein